MKVEIKPTQDPEILKQNLEKRVQEVERKDEKLIAEMDKGSVIILERTPGIEEYEAGDEVREGLKGRPVQEQAYARLDSKRDLARAVVATIDGYDLRIFDTENRWDLKILRSFNPGVKELKMEEPSEALGIEKTLDSQDQEHDQVEMEISEEEVDTVLRFASLENEG
ncbi:MAG: hypothetical protein ABEJ36_02880 [Candidatus Nanosalina sp.]